jgi:hypothetical protein
MINLMGQVNTGGLMVDGELKFNYQGDMLLLGAGIAQLVEQLICNQ